MKISEIPKCFGESPDKLEKCEECKAHIKSYCLELYQIPSDSK